MTDILERIDFEDLTNEIIKNAKRFEYKGKISLYLAERDVKGLISNYFTRFDVYQQIIHQDYETKKRVMETVKVLIVKRTISKPFSIFFFTD